MSSPETPATGASYRSFQVGDWVIDPAAGQITRDGVPVKLEHTVMEVLSYPASRPGELVTRDDLEREVWKRGIVSYDSTTAAVLKLQKALTDDARQPRYIETVPQRGYRLIAAVQDPAAEAKEEETRKPTGFAPGRKAPRANLSKVLLSAVFLALVVGLSLFFYRSKQAQDGNTVSSSSLSIVVLPFANLSSDPDQEYFADGMTDYIVTDLSRLSNLLVISGGTSSAYKGREVHPKEIGAKLGVDYVLDGSIRRYGDEIRINARLVDTKTGFQKWALRYGRFLVEVFAVQDEATNSIVKARAVELTSQEEQRLRHRNTDNLKAYEIFQQGQRLAKIGSKETNEQAQEAYRQVIRLDPNYGRAYGALAYQLAYTYRRGWAKSPLATLDRHWSLQSKVLHSMTPFRRPTGLSAMCTSCERNTPMRRRLPRKP